MITAREATQKSNQAIIDMQLAAIKDGNDTLTVIEQYIVLAAEEGKYEIDFPPFKLHSYTEEIKNKAYLNRIIEVLESCGYVVVFHGGVATLHITWPH